LDPATIFEKIDSVNPGEVLKIDLATGINQSISIMRNSFPSGKSNLRKILTKAVLDRIHGHEKVALSLSGGLDSAIIAIILAENSIKAKCYSASWQDSDKYKYNLDALHARAIAENLGLEFKEVAMLKTSQLELELFEFLKAMEEPNNNPSGVSMMKLYREIAADGNRLVLTGDGADEVFAGYSRYSKCISLKNVLNFQNGFLRRQTLSERKILNANISSFLETQISPKCAESWLYWHSIFKESETAKNFKVSLAGTRKRVENLSNVEQLGRLFETVLQRDREIWLPMESNRKLDRVSMYYSIEARSPFQDENVIGIGADLMEPFDSKKLGKQVLWAAFPEAQQLGVRKDKAGFISPIGHWLRNNPELISKSLDNLVSAGLIDSQLKENMLRIPDTRDFDALKKLWSLVVLGSWVEISFGNFNSGKQ
jgi:asparagine synthase (glutamine-hydrolysing)